jgi:K+ transport systems, NAD-binding component
MKPRIIVCGLGSTGYKIFRLLRQQEAAVVGISDRPLVTEEDNVVIGDLRAASTLRRAGIEEAHTLVLSSNDDALNLAILTQARILNPQIRIINRLFNTSLGNRLDQTLPDHVSLSVSALVSTRVCFLRHWVMKRSGNCDCLIKLGPSTKKLSLKIIPGSDGA